jgi:hypothetical protein
MLSDLSAKARFLLFWGLAGFLELPVLLLMTGLPSPISFGLGLLCHACAAVLLFFAPPREKGWFRRTRHWGEPLAVMAFFLPPVGWALAGWSVLRHWDATQHKEAYRFEDEAEEGVNPLAGAGTAEAVRRQLADALDVIPAVDALLSQSSNLKRGAIETLGRIRSPEAIGWILKARVDADPEVRFYATTALTRLKRDFETAVLAAEKETYKRPGDPQTHMTLHRVRYEYAVSGILEKGARDAALKECREKLQPFAGRYPEASWLLYLVELTLDPTRAAPLLDELESSGFGGKERWLRERAQLLFALNRHAELRALLAARESELAAETDRSPEAADWRAAAMWWKA